jgi:hypothetical protein
MTLNILLSAVEGGRLVRRIELGRIVDDDVGRSRLEGAMQQVERAERLLKMLWREKYATVEYRDWRERYRVLDARSEQVRSAAMTVLEQFLA